MKSNQSRSGFKLVSTCPFPTIITIATRVPPIYIYIYIYICVCVCVCVCMCARMSICVCSSMWHSWVASTEIFSMCFVRVLRWEVSGCTVAVLRDAASGIFFKTVHNICVVFSTRFFFMCFVCIYPHSSIDATTLWRNSCFPLSDILDFSAFVNLSVPVETFVWCIWTSLSVNEILQRYVY